MAFLTFLLLLLLLLSISSTMAVKDAEMDTAGWVWLNATVDEAEDDIAGMMMIGAISQQRRRRRVLRHVAPPGQRFISYGALKKDQTPCSRRGQSYYNCHTRAQANPYHRGCSVITRCGRIID